MVLPSFEHNIRKWLLVAVIRIWLCIFRSIWNTCCWRLYFAFVNDVTLFIRCYLNVHHVLLHLIDLFHWWIFPFNLLYLSLFVYQLDFFLKPLSSTRNRNYHVILSKAIVNEVYEVAIGPVNLVDLFQHAVVVLHFRKHGLTLLFW